MSTRSAPVYGTSHDDDIDKSSATGGQMINSLQGDDTVIGSEFDDRIYLGSGDDSAQGGGGNDIVVGGDGTDTAVYRGSIFDFTWSEIRTDILEVTDTNTTNGDDGTDTLRGVEQLQFDDFLFVMGGANAAYMSGVTDQTTDEDSAKSFSFEAWDFDGGDVTIHSITGTSGGSFSIDGHTPLSSGMGVGKNFTVSFDLGADYQHLGMGQSVTEQVEVVVSDGQGNLTTKTFQMTIDGVNDDPTINGISNNNATVSEDGVLAASGVVTASDVDQGDALSYAVQGGGTGAYGSLSIDAQGNWTYNLDNSSAAVQALNAGPAVQDVFTVEVSDGNGGFAYEDITVNVQGADEASRVQHVIDFDDAPYALGSSNSQSYDGFIFIASGSHYNDDPGLIASEYDFVDPDKEVYNGWAHKYLTVAQQGGGEFDFTSVDLGDNSNQFHWLESEANTLLVTGHRGGSQVYSQSVELTNVMTTKMFDFYDVDEIRIEVTGGTNFGNGVEGTGWYSMDNMEFWV